MENTENIIKIEKKAYPKIIHAILLCLLLLGIQGITGFALGKYMSLTDYRGGQLVYGLGLIFLSIFSFGLVIFIGFKKTGKSFNEVFMFNHVSLKIWIAVIVFMFGFIILSSELDNLLKLFLPMPDFIKDLFSSMLSSQYLVITIILIGITPAFAEEMLFRGVFLYGLKNNYSRNKTIIITALLFGLIHLNPWQFVTAFIMGLIAAWICLQVNSILPCIYMHLFNNVIYVLLNQYNGIIQIKGFNTAHIERSFQPLWFNALGVVFAGIGILIFISYLEKERTRSDKSF